MAFRNAKKPPSLIALWNRSKEAECALRLAIDERYPIGSRVVVKWGKGLLYGTVAGGSMGRGTVMVRSDKGGQIHQKHFLDVSFG